MKLLHIVAVVFYSSAIDTVGEGVMFSGCPFAALVRSFVSTDLITTRYLMNGLIEQSLWNLQGTFISSCWWPDYTVEVKVTAGRRRGEGIHVVASPNPSSRFMPICAVPVSASDLTAYHNCLLLWKWFVFFGRHKSGCDLQRSPYGITLGDCWINCLICGDHWPVTTCLENLEKWGNCTVLDCRIPCRWLITVSELKANSAFYYICKCKIVN